MTDVARESAPRPRRWPYALSVVIAGSLSVLLGLSVVWRSEGWPLNHEGTTWVCRVRVVAEALSHGDPLPVWYVSGAEGLGEAMPLFYHKLFNLVAAACYLVVGSYKVSMCLGIFVFGMVGVAGLYATCRRLGLGSLAAVAVGATFPHLNYAVTDWMVRGAVAEYAAFALCTWVIWWTVRLLAERRFGVSIGPILLLVLLAHSVIAYYAAWLLLVGYLVFCLSHPEAVRATTRPALLAVGVFLIGAVPLVVLIVRAGGEANLSYLHIYTPTDQYQPLRRYLFDPFYRWGERYDSYTVQLDLFFVLGCAAFSILLLGVCVRRWRRGEPIWRPGPLGPRLVFSSLAFGLFFLLQTRAATPFYRYVPGAAFVQFPWRLLCFLSPLLVCLFVCLSRLAAEVDGRLATGLVFAVSLGTIGLNSGRTLSYPFYPRAEVEDGYAATWEEYWPVHHREGGRVGLSRAELADYAKRGAELLGEADGRIREVESGRYMERVYEVRCAGPCEVALPVAFSGMEVVSAGRKSGRLATYRTPEDPRLRFVAPPGESRVRVGLPTATRALRTLFGP